MSDKPIAVGEVVLRKWLRDIKVRKEQAEFRLRDYQSRAHFEELDIEECDRRIEMLQAQLDTYMETPT